MSFSSSLCGFLLVLGLLVQGRIHCEAQVRPLKDKGVSRAVVVGVSEYKDPAIGNLAYAHKDAEAFANFLRSEAGGGLEENHIQLLVNEKATGAGFIGALQWLIDESQAGDQAYIYFSGHGHTGSFITQPEYFLLSDAKANTYQIGGALEISKFQLFISSLSVVKNVKVIVIADACRSGKLKSNQVNGSDLFGEEMAKQVANELKILSCQPHEDSREGTQWGGGRGVFTYYLLEGLSGLADEDEDGVVTLLETQSYLQSRVSKDVAPAKQMPMVITTNWDQALVQVDPEVAAEARKRKPGDWQQFYPAFTKSVKEDRILSNVDTSIQRIYKAFYQALEDKQFFEPEMACADYYFQVLMAQPSLSTLHGDIKRNYAVALQDDAQDVLNRILSMSSEELNKSFKISANQYRLYPSYLYRALEILGDKNIMYPAIKARSYLFEGIIGFLDTRSKRNEEIAWNIVSSFKRVLEIQPENTIALFYLMETYSLRMSPAHYDSSKYYYIQVKEIDPSWLLPDAIWGNRLTQYYNKPDEAISVLEGALEIDSFNSFVLMSLGNFHYRTENYIKAISYYQTINNTSPEDHIAWTNIGLCYYQMGKYLEAEIAYQSSLRINKNQFPANLALCQLYIDLKQIKEAEEAGLMAVFFNANNKDARYLLSRVYLASGNFEEVEKQCQVIEKLDPQNFRHWFYRACMASVGKDEKLANQYLENALKNGLNSKELVMDEPLLSFLHDKNSFNELITNYFPN